MKTYLRRTFARLNPAIARVNTNAFLARKIRHGIAGVVVAEKENIQRREADSKRGSLSGNLLAPGDIDSVDNELVSLFSRLLLIFRTRDNRIFIFVHLLSK